MNISLRHMRHYVAVATELHFRKAAEQTNTAQPALSRSVQLLEQELGVQLLERNNRNVRLTLAGNEFLAGCKQVLSIMESTISETRKAGNNELNSISIAYNGFAISGKLPELLSRFCNLHADVTVTPVQLNTADQLHKIANGELDFCFLTGPVNSPNLDWLVIQKDDFVAIVDEAHPLASRHSVSIHELKDETVLLGSQGYSSNFNSHILKLCSSAGFEPKVSYSAHGHQDILGLVACGKGISYSTENIGHTFPTGLKRLKVTGTRHQLPIVMGWHKNQTGDAASIFRNFIVDNTLVAERQAPQDNNTIGVSR